MLFLRKGGSGSFKTASSLLRCCSKLIMLIQHWVPVSSEIKVVGKPITTLFVEILVVLFRQRLKFVKAKIFI